MKKTLYIINTFFIDEISTLKKYNINYIKSNKLLDISYSKLEEMIIKYDIIIIGGGPQHLVNDERHKYPEIEILLNIVKICDNINKLLIGICLGCQIIALYYNMNIIKLEKVCLGINNINTQNIDRLNKDIYLHDIDNEILENVFSFHYDAITNIKDKDNNNIDTLVYSKSDNPYIIKHKRKQIYGFQFHPELNVENINILMRRMNIDKIFDNNKINNSIYILDNFLK
jgi:carbamoylphosphate synthase small subunit